MIINSLILAVSSSIDSLGIGITYGIKNTKISLLARFILFILSFIISIISIWFGDILKNLFSESLIKFIGSTILILMGVFICFQALNNKQNDNTFDFNNSNTIEPKEALFLGLALSLDSFCIGTCGSIIGVHSILFPIFISAFQLFFLEFGDFLGSTLHAFTNFPNNICSIISGFLLMIIGIIRFLCEFPFFNL